MYSVDFPFFKLIFPSFFLFFVAYMVYMLLFYLSFSNKFVFKLETELFLIILHICWYFISTSVKAAQKCLFENML